MRSLRPYTLIPAVLILLAGCNAGEPERSVTVTTLPEFDTLWDYFDPVGTRAKFEAVLPEIEAKGDFSEHLQLQTQIARTYGLEGSINQALRLLHDVSQKLDSAPDVVRVRYLLEQGRTLRTSGQIPQSQPLFEEAYNLSASIGADFHTIDAAHMLALVAVTDTARERWSLIGLERAEKTPDPRAKKWLGSISNNMGWDYHDRREYERALELFEKARAYHEAEGNPDKIRIARWTVGRCLRSLERYDEALAIQQSILAEAETLGTNDGYVFEELGELYLQRGEQEQAREYFRQAYTALSQDTWMMENESSRMERIRRLGGLPAPDGP